MKESSERETIFARARAALVDHTARTDFGDVAEAAQPFFAALIADLNKDQLVWMVCPDARAQEEFSAELSAWLPTARLLPGLEAPVADDVVLPDPETVAERLEILGLLARGQAVGPLVIHHGQWQQEVPSVAALTGSLISLTMGDTVRLAEVGEKLAAAGYERAGQVATRGQFAIRGGILDVFSWQSSLPVRIELDDEIVDSIRSFDPDNQISVGELNHCEIFAAKLETNLVPLRSYFHNRDTLIDLTGDEERPTYRISNETNDGDAAIYPQPLGAFDAGDLVLDAVRRDRLFHQIGEWKAADWLVALAAGSEGEIERFQELAHEHDFDVSGVVFLQLPITRGFVFPAARLAVFSDAELFGRSSSLRQRRRLHRRERMLASRATIDFTEFEPGDYVVHLDHGIGRFAGLQAGPGGDGGEALVLEYAGDAKLYVPLNQAWQVARYVGIGKTHPELSELGDGRWARTREKAQRSILDYASRILRVQAERDMHPGFAFGPDTHWQSEFEDAFPFEETPDQIRAIAETKGDMEVARPMDRLICGDVG
ncbi:MAG TPA: CarD family transcriptional regulator, partial [Terrimicrobiaceae bacterium]